MIYNINIFHSLATDQDHGSRLVLFDLCLENNIAWSEDVGLVHLWNSTTVPVWTCRAGTVEVSGEISMSESHGESSYTHCMSSSDCGTVDGLFNSSSESSSASLNVQNCTSNSESGTETYSW